MRSLEAVAVRLAVLTLAFCVVAADPLTGPRRAVRSRNQPGPARLAQVPTSKQEKLAWPLFCCLVTSSRPTCGYTLPLLTSVVFSESRMFSAQQACGGQIRCSAVDPAFLMPFFL